MKVRLSKVLCAALLASLICTNSYAKIQADGIDYTHTAKGDGTYNSTVKIGDGVNTTHAGGTYIKQGDGNTVFNNTQLCDVSISMTGGTITGTLSANTYHANPVDGKVDMNITGGSVDTLIGGNHLCTSNKDNYIDSADIDSITITVGGNAVIEEIRGGNLVGVEGGMPSDAFMESYTQTGDISINVMDEAKVTTINGSGCDTVNGDININVKGGTVTNLYANNGGTVSADVEITISDGSVDTLFNVLSGKVSGNASTTMNGGYLYWYAGSCGGSIEGSSSFTMNGGKVDFIYGTSASGASIKKDIITTINDGEVYMLYGVNGGSVGGNADVTVTGGAVQNIYVVKAGEVAKDANLTIEGNANETYVAVGVDGGTVKGNTTVTLKDGKVAYLEAISNGIVHGDAMVKVEGGEVTGGVYGSCLNGKVGGNVNVNISGGVVSTLYAVTNGSVGTADNDKSGDVKVTFDGGKVAGDIIGVSGGTVSKDVTLELKGGSVGKNVSAVAGGTVAKDVTVVLNGSEVGGTVAGAYSGHVDGNVTIAMNGGTAEHIHTANIGTVTGDTNVYLLGGTVTGDLYGGDANLVDGTRTLYVGSEDKAYNGTVNDFYGFDRVIIASGSSLQATDSNFEVFEIKEQQYNVTGDNLKTAAITTSSTVSIEDAITLNFNVSKSLRSGRYMLIDATNGTVDTTNWTEENVTINNVTTGTTYNRRAATATGQHTVSFNDLKWIDSILYLFVVAEDLQNTLAGNWGVFKSSQAFVSTLWGGRTNAVIIPGTSDGKGGLIPSGQTIAWGRVYGQSSRIGGIGADYSLFGGAIGAEQRFVTGRTLGAAMGYDWGKVTPFGLSRIDQETAHFALYGRAASWKAGQKGNIVIDWSAAVGNTTSETDAINGEWEQKNMQLDARASYLRQMSEKATGSVFAGVQYFAAEDAAAGTTQVSSMQNLRTEAGVGLSYKATSKTTVYGEASVYNDAMRHNPTTCANGASYSGTNPGRLGSSVSVGTMYELNERWNLHGNYSFDMADDSKEHNVNVGASYEF
ncbi:MAG: autotransporter domain-containing protein [Akkermansia sp.]|nr:autotransporter domain-containing protein [Akkermansia sp.]